MFTASLQMPRMMSDTYLVLSKYLLTALMSESHAVSIQKALASFGPYLWKCYAVISQDRE